MALPIYAYDAPTLEDRHPGVAIGGDLEVCRMRNGEWYTVVVSVRKLCIYADSVTLCVTGQAGTFFLRSCLLSNVLYQISPVQTMVTVSPAETSEYSMTVSGSTLYPSIQSSASPASIPNSLARLSTTQATASSGATSTG
ncbi:hypothetical protein CALCODRAFT_33976 [Calocera cornea HHB12733]|uniref:Uncharacterized protein n=1 Tax=Calocera cornea HHB12733 TaxID=1353952 RepID=A0A165E108_9BASI|nr:hypothetical protein CALCODRAFT_33976 [Calocera cornea HHB12733]